MATPLSSTVTAQTHGPHDLDAVGDFDDWFAIPMVAGVTYHFDTAGGTGDDFGALYSDPAGTVLEASDDDSGGSGQFSFNYTAVATQTYYLDVSNFSGVALNSSRQPVQHTKYSLPM